jgi:acetyl-CoA carboxylase carboxyltransferase component
MSWKPEVDEIERRRTLALGQGGEAAVAKQHSQNRLTLRERVDHLLDAGSFEELGPVAGTPVHNEAGDLVSYDPANFILGFGKVAGRRIIVGGEDFTMRGGSPSAAGLRKSVYAEDLAVQYKIPLVRLHEGAGGSVGGTGGKGASLPGPVNAPSRFRSVAQAMATVPVATAAMGAVAGLPAGRLVASHFSVMSKSTAQIITAGPAVVERAMGEKKDQGRVRWLESAHQERHCR